MEAWNEAGQTEQVRKGKRNLDASRRRWVSSNPKILTKTLKLEVQIWSKTKIEHRLLIPIARGLWRLGMKRVKRSKYEKKSVIWMRVLGTQGLWVTIKQLLKDRTHTLEASA
uniref:Uncharacterized protein n=1 Tax=Helianthus annuus TaxID=4232 RepID=A0A251VB22_HELAN